MKYSKLHLTTSSIILMPSTPYYLLPILFLLCSCASTFYTSRIDLTASGGILWPGEPEKPRIKYLWSLQNVNYTEAAGALDILAGIDDPDNPKYSPILLRPQGVYVDEKRLYIADPGAGRITVIDRNNMRTFHILDADNEELQYPVSVVSDKAGNIYVSDPELKKVMIYSSRGRFVSFFEGEFLRPSGLGIDRQRNIIYVADTLGHKVYVYSTSGKRLGEIGGRGEGDGEFNYPGYLSVDRNGYLYVSDSLNFRIQIFGSDGRFIKKFGEPGNAYHTLDKPKGVAADSEGNIYVVDAGMDMVKIFNQEGRLLLFFGEKGHDYGKFYLPTGIFIDEQDVIYVADTINMRIQAFEFLGGK
ncbi:MAG: 6-bladed beta-propeller [Thermodesulfovibrionales bacterium]|nr:6-bladed beta-propeller [Thermodesulfovibrionales bacterium]